MTMRSPRSNTKIQASIRPTVNTTLETSIRRIIERLPNQPPQQADYDAARAHLRKVFWSDLISLRVSPDDLLGEAIARAVARQDQRAAVDSATGWFTAVARNLVIDKARDSSRSLIEDAEQFDDEHAPDESQAGAVEAAITLEWFRRFLEHREDAKLLAYFDLQRASSKYGRNKIKVIMVKLGIDQSEYNALWKRLRLALRRFGSDQM